MYSKRKCILKKCAEGIKSIEKKKNTVIHWYKKNVRNRYFVAS